MLYIYSRYYHPFTLVVVFIMALLVACQFTPEPFEDDLSGAASGTTHTASDRPEVLPTAEATTGGSSIHTEKVKESEISGRKSEQGSPKNVHTRSADSPGDVKFIQVQNPSGSEANTATNFSTTDVKYAEGFDLIYHDDYKLLEIYRPFQDTSTDTLRYALVPRDNLAEVEVAGAQKIPIPVESLIATSTTHIALTDMLNANDRLVGMVGAELVYNPEIRRRLEEDKITAFPEGELNREVALTLDPELIMISGGQSSQYDNFKVLVESGINVLVNVEWLETSPLGKAEWVKVMAALLDREQLANKKFEEVARRYHKLKKLVHGRQEGPLVINNIPYKGAWFVSGGNSYTARFLKDAGADYPWFDSQGTGGLRKSFEVVYEIGLRADIWIQPGTAESKREVLGYDQRFRDFKSFQSGHIYNNNRRQNETGGNDFWETGVVRPDQVLADLIYIFHPEVLPEHELNFYQKLD